MKPRFEELKPIVAKIAESMSRVSDPSIDLELEKLRSPREKLQTCIEDIRDEFQERDPSEKLNGLKARRTKHRHKMMDRARSFVERLKHNFPEGFESAGMQAADRDLKRMATKCVNDDWRSVLDRLSGLVRDGLTRIYFLQQTETSMKQELAQLEEWHARADGHGILIVGKRAKCQKELKRARWARENLKNELTDAQEDNDAEEIERITPNLTVKSEEIKTMQADLDQGFLQAAGDRLHFPEESPALVKMLEGPPTLLRYWKEKSFNDFKVQKELFGGSHRVFKVQRQEGSCCTVLKQFPVNEGTRKEVNREAARMIELHHPNIMPLLSMFFEDK